MICLSKATAGERRRALLALALVTTVAASAVPVRAEEEGGGTFTLHLENDRIASTDRNYTHGSRLSWVSDRKTYGPEWVRDLFDFLYPLAEMRAGRIGFALGQNIYTPEDTESSALVADERPYAGWLYGAVSAYAETNGKFAGHDLNVLDSVEFSLGVVGPYAVGEETQNTIHEILGIERSLGWDNQLDTEPAVALFFERKWRPQPWTVHGFEVDAIPHVGGSIGNVFTLANIGATVRFGKDLHVDYGPPHIRPTLSGLEAVDTARRFAWYVFAGIEGSAVLRNIFLDGNTFSDSHGVDKNTWVGGVQLGFAVVIEDVRVALTHVYRTREFETQGEGDNYGTLSISVRF